LAEGVIKHFVSPFIFLNLLLPLQTAISLSSFWHAPLLLAPTKQEAQKSQAEKSVVTLAGIVLPSDAHPGEQVSGTIVKEPKRYDRIPGLQVVKMEVPLNRGEDGEASFQGVVVDLGDGQRQRAQDGLKVRIPDGATHIPIIVKIAERPQFVVERDIPISVERSVEKLVITGTLRGYKTSPVCLDGDLRVIHGPFSGDSHATTIEAGGHAVQIVAETPRAVYWQLLSGAPIGTQRIALHDGSRTAAFRVIVLSLEMSAD
jgi:hypothetical protein